MKYQALGKESQNLKVRFLERGHCLEMAYRKVKKLNWVSPESFRGWSGQSHQTICQTIGNFLKVFRKYWLILLENSQLKTVIRTLHIDMLNGSRMFWSTVIFIMKDDKIIRSEFCWPRSPNCCFQWTLLALQGFNSRTPYGCNEGFTFAAFITWIHLCTSRSWTSSQKVK